MNAPVHLSETTLPLLDAVAAQADAELAPLVASIDQQGVYPADYLRNLGALGGFSASVPHEMDGPGIGLATQIDITTRIGSKCGSTAFMVWCQSTCVWYLQHSPNAAVRQRYLKPVSEGTLFSGTGMSNTVKHLAGIEKMQLSARRDGDDCGDDRSECRKRRLRDVCGARQRRRFEPQFLPFIFRNGRNTNLEFAL